MSNNCPNCNIAFQGKFCHQCGQKYVAKRVTFWNIISDYFVQIFSFERSGIATFAQIIVAPQKIIFHYLNGYRNYYQSPGRLLLYFITIAGLYVFLVSEKLFGMSISVGELSPQVGLIVILIPLLTLSSYLTYLKSKRHFGEHFIAQTYLFAVFGIIVIIMEGLLRKLFDQDIEFNVFGILILAIVLWTSFVFSQNRKWYIYVLNTLLNTIVFILIIALILMVAYYFGGVQIN